MNTPSASQVAVLIDRLECIEIKLLCGEMVELLQHPHIKVWGTGFAISNGHITLNCPHSREGIRPALLQLLGYYGASMAFGDQVATEQLIHIALPRYQLREPSLENFLRMVDILARFKVISAFTVGSYDLVSFSELTAQDRALLNVAATMNTVHQLM